MKDDVAGLEESLEKTNAGNPEVVEDSESALVATEEHTLIAASYRGPLPPAIELKRYEEVLPGLAKTIVDSWGEESAHRRSLEKTQVTEIYRLAARGQLLAASLAVVFFFGSMYLVSKGHQLEGLALVVAEIVALSCAFLYGRKNRDADSDDAPGSEEDLD